jgi:hypothetical protein
VSKGESSYGFRGWRGRGERLRISRMGRKAEEERSYGFRGWRGRGEESGY